MTPNIVWKNATGKYSNGQLAKLGKYTVGSAYYDSCKSREDPLKYASACLLPGIKNILGYFATDIEAKEMVEKAVNHWLKGIREQHEA